MTPHEGFDIGQNMSGYHIFSKQDDRPTIGSFNTSAEAVEFAKQGYDLGKNGKVELTK